VRKGRFAMTDYANKFIRTVQPVTPTELAEVERVFRFSFPTQFRDHYLEHNGGRPQKNLFKKDDTIFVINEFLPIKYGRTNCLFEDVFRDLKIEKQVLPEYLVPFADDPGGDYYCFSVRDRDLGSIWIYRGEYYDDPERALTYLESSLTEFIESMVADEP
jgi:hypothetical protein